MNKNLHKYASCAVVAATMALSTACGNKHAAADSATGNLTVKEITWEDSIAVNNCTAKSEVSVAYPTDGNQALLDSTRLWIAQTLITTIPVDTAAVDTTFAPGALADGEKLIACAGKRFLTEADNDFRSFDSADGFSFNYGYQAEIDKGFSTDSVVTFNSSTYIYTGGAHGATLVNSATFRTSDGAVLGYEIFNPSAIPELTQMVKDALSKQYFEGDDDFKMEDALIIDPQDFRLPANPPYFTDKGVTFIYQQYEIACYAAGLPTCTLPYAEIAPLLLPAYRPLLP